MLKDGDYANQRLVVPKEQVEAVQKSFPDKTVTDHIGGTDKIDIQSEGLTKEQVKSFQKDAQGNRMIQRTDWNVYQTKELALNIGKQAGQAGIHAALLGTGIHLVEKAVDGEPVEADEVVKTAITTGQTQA